MLVGLQPPPALRDLERGRPTARTIIALVYAAHNDGLHALQPGSPRYYRGFSPGFSSTLNLIRDRSPPLRFLAAHTTWKTPSRVPDSRPRRRSPGPPSVSSSCIKTFGMPAGGQLPTGQSLAAPLAAAVRALAARCHRRRVPGSARRSAAGLRASRIRSAGGFARRLPPQRSGRCRSDPQRLNPGRGAAHLRAPRRGSRSCRASSPGTGARSPAPPRSASSRASAAAAGAAATPAAGAAAL